MNPIDQLKGMAPYQRNRIFAFIGIGFFIALLIIGFIVFRDPGSLITKNVAIEFWDASEEWTAYSEVISIYNERESGVFVNYVQKDPETYRKELTEALARGEGPDIYMIKNNWLPMEENRLVPMNDHLPSDPLSPESSVSPAEMISRFPDVVRFDFTRENVSGEPIIYALPLSIDTLALYYNEDYFNTHTILDPPSTWDEFVAISKTLRSVSGDRVDLSGAALGDGENIKHSSDILAALMLQTGAPMNDESGFVTFDQPVSSRTGQSYPGQDALQFYTSFANQNSENYTWDAEASISSLEAFGNGTTAMMLGYASDIDEINKENRHLNFSPALLPQPSENNEPVYYASYWGLAVSESAEDPDAAWDFINFLMDEYNARIYLDASGNPPALKSLIADYNPTDGLKVFADQITNARSWIQPNAIESEKLLNMAIGSVIRGEKSIPAALSEAADKINLLWRNL